MAMLGGKLICLIDKNYATAGIDGFINELFGATDTFMGQGCTCGLFEGRTWEDLVERQELCVLTCNRGFPLKNRLSMGIYYLTQKHKARMSLPVPGLPRNTTLKRSPSIGVLCRRVTSILSLIRSICLLTSSNPIISMTASIAEQLAPSISFWRFHSSSGDDFFAVAGLPGGV